MPNRKALNTGKLPSGGIGARQSGIGAGRCRPSIQAPVTTCPWPVGPGTSEKGPGKNRGVGVIAKGLVGSRDVGQTAPGMGLVITLPPKGLAGLTEEKIPKVAKNTRK